VAAEVEGAMQILDGARRIEVVKHGRTAGTDPQQARDVTVY
jgi:hypothetical protein